MRVDVLIVGAGPTGLMLANQLARRGVHPIVIDRHSGPAQQSRAMAVHARTLEIYAKLGIAARAVERGTQGNGANLWVRGKRKARVPLEEMGKNLSPFPYVLMLGQDENERIMGDRLRELGVAVEWNTELVALEQHAGYVTATVRQQDGTRRTIEAAYVAGCDGSRSAVRQMNGIGFPGAAYEQSFFVADTEATGPMVPDELNVYLWRDGFHLYFPMPGRNRWRVIGILPRALSPDTNPTFEQLLPSLQQQGARGLSFTSCLWFSTYRIHHRRTERFRDRRCFLLGDAAHVHSPMGGQGMNTGLQDAYNLAWKLALVVAGRAADPLLDTYEAERVPFADRLLSTTDRAFRLVVSDSWLGGVLRTRIFPSVAAIAMKPHFMRRFAFMTLSQIGTEYRASPLSQTIAGVAKGAPAAGERFPWLQLGFAGGNGKEDLFERLDDRTFNLLVIGQPAPSIESLGVGDLLATHVVPLDGENAGTLAAVSIASPAYYVLRPDGHIGLAGTRVDAREIARWFATCSMQAGKADRSGRAAPRDDAPAS
jgi:2-polyprenyl-6-methoxyphenol hydroxylase-like FAD-dependent oxidoreductase